MKVGELAQNPFITHEINPLITQNPFTAPYMCSDLKSTYDGMGRENTGNKKRDQNGQFYSDRNLYDTTTFRTINASYASFFLGCSNGAADLSTQVFQSFASWGWMWLAYFPSMGLSVCTLSAWGVLWVLWEFSAVQEKKNFHKGNTQLTIQSWIG